MQKAGHRRPVDDFFRSLANEQKEKSICIVLSGMGTNGTTGAQAVKAAGGLCIAQDPQSAEFPSMPRSLIIAGLADYVLPPREIPAALRKYLDSPYFEANGAEPSAEQLLQREQRHHFSEVLAILRAQTGREFSGYKKATLLRRIQRRMGLAHQRTLADYVETLRRSPPEVLALSDDLTINVTGFFRDPEAWEALRSQVLAPLVAKRDNAQPIRAWVAGCATGEEAYTLAMLLVEEVERANKHFDIKIFSTDTAEKALGHARAGVFPTGIEGEVSAERLERFFDKDDHTFRIRKEIREMVVFAPQNLLTDPPFSRLDLCTCRNLLIYLEPATQARVIGLLHFALREGGCMFLGNSETVGTSDDLFEPINRKWRLYRRIGPTRHGMIDFPLGHAKHPPLEEEAAAGRPGLGAVIQRVLTEKFGPPLVVVDRRQRVTYYHGDTDRYLMQPAGEPTRNLHDLVREGLRSAVRAVLRQSINAGGKPVSAEARLAGTRGAAKVKITASALMAGRSPDYFIVAFDERGQTARTGAAGEAGDGAEMAAPTQAPAGEAGNGIDVQDPVQLERDGLEHELRSVREELQSTIEELESSNEELKASNEEVTSVNEELQSTNEELETSKEELQSLNEELTTVNSQLQAKIEELEATTNDLTNLLSSTDIAVMFLDTTLHIRRFTPAMRDLLDLLPADIGRPISHLAPKFDGSDLVRDAESVLRTLIPTEGEILSHSGRWYAHRTLPYRTSDNRIDGVVLTFIDVTQRKRGEDAVRGAQWRLQAVLEQMPAAVLIAEAPSGRLVLGNHQAATMFGHPFPLPFLDAEWAAAYVAFKGFHADGRPLLRDEWPLARALATGAAVVDEEIRFVRADGTAGVLLASAAPVRDASESIIAAVATFWDISDRTRAALSLRESERRFRLLVEGAHDYAIMMVDPDGRISTWNSGAAAIFGRSETEAVGQPLAILFTPEDQQAQVPQHELQEASRSNRAPDDRWMMRQDGVRFWASGSVTALRSDSGVLRGYLKILRDTTELKRAEAGLRQAKSQAESLRESAEAANRAKDDFVAMVSHELRTPLTAILLWARMLRDHKVDARMLQEGVAIIDRSARAQQKLVDDLLDVSRMMSGKLRLSIRDMALTEAVEAAVAAVRPAAEARGVALIADLEPVGIVRADPDRIQQVMWNLLSNAVKFTPSGGRVEAKVRRDGGDVIMSVSDTGIGMDAEFLPLLFDRFRQAQVGSTREHSGLGLGLAIARQLVELHGGSLRGDSDGKGKGATFTARLPLAQLREDERLADEPLAQTASINSARILLVEDEELTRDAIEALLRSAGAQVTAVDAAGAALEMLPLHKFDLMVSDIAMPGMDGYALMKEMRRLEQHNGANTIRAVALSAFARTEDQRRASEAGFDAYLVKPVDPDRLISVLAGLLRRD